MVRKKQSDAEKTPETINKKEIPTSNRLPSKSFPIIGISASAGGLAAFEAFFTAMPADTDSGMAFVLIQQLAPDQHEHAIGSFCRSVAPIIPQTEDALKKYLNWLRTKSLF